MSDAATRLVTEEEYLGYEVASDGRNEFVDGVIRVMTGASIRHNDVALNLAVQLRGAAAGTGCRVNIEGVRLKVSSRRHYYPDVMVNGAGSDDDHAYSTPCLIAEVASPTTLSVDRGEKRLAYLAMPSLRHLLLIDQEAETIEHVWRSTTDEAWRFELLTTNDVLRLTCPSEVAIDVGAVFAQV